MTDNKPPARAGEFRDSTWVFRRLRGNLLLSQADLALLESIKPRCAKCNKQVDTLSWRRDFADPLVVVFTVSCHGAMENTRVPFSKFHELMQGAVHGAEAFVVDQQDKIYQETVRQVLNEKDAFGDT